MFGMLIDGLTGLHIVAGFVGLVAFWVPIFAKKGAANHKRFGKVFVNAGWVVVASAAIASLINIAVALGHDLTPTQFHNIIGVRVFLLYLALVVGTQLYYGVLVFAEKKDQTKHATRFNYGLSYALTGASVVVIAYALIWKPGAWIVLLALSPIGFLVSSGMRSYMGARIRSKRQWWYEHMGTFLTCGIAFHTAFAVFGAARLFSVAFEGPFAIIPWIAPALIGVPGAMIWEAHYRKKFSDPKQTGKIETEGTA